MGNPVIPFHFWTPWAFAFGAIVGSFLNVCIHRMPRGESIVSPPSHCPHCGYSIPWYLNVPLVTWLWLRGRCAHCKAGISARYFLVELMTALFFAASWIRFGHISVGLVLAHCLMLSGMIVGTFIDVEHMIVPDAITFGGMVAGLFCSFLVPELHFNFPPFVRLKSPTAGLIDGFIGLAVGAGVVYAVLRFGKLVFGRQKINLAPGTRVSFTETGIKLPGEEVLFEELFYRPKTDAVVLKAERVELVDRCYCNVPVRLKATELKIAGDTFDPEKVLFLEVVTDRIVLPREAMGPADVTFLAAVGAFLGWPAAIFSLAMSSPVGIVVTATLMIFKRRDASGRLPYVPYLAAGAVIWIFGGHRWMLRLLGGP